MPCDGLLHRIVVPVKLVADCGSDEVRSVRVEALLDEKVHLSQIDVPQVDGNLLAIHDPGPYFTHVTHEKHPAAIRRDGIWTRPSDPQGPPGGRSASGSHPMFGSLTRTCLRPARCTASRRKAEHG